MKALLVVDIQNDFLPGGALGVPEGDEIIETVNKLQIYNKFDLVVGTQDCHPADHGSFASQYEGKNPLDRTTLAGLDQILWPDHCVRGTRGAQFPDQLDTRKMEAIFRKGMEKDIDTYSAFFDNGHKKDTGLAGYLRARNIDHVYIVGLAGDFCVNFSIRDALNEGFKVTLIKDCTRPINQSEFENVLKELSELGTEVIESGDLLN
jgi:nicotinamidase/pyrazinamidase